MDNHPKQLNNFISGNFEETLQFHFHHIKHHKYSYWLSFKWYRVKDFFYDCKNGISNIVKWISTIWKLRDWDACYIYLLIYKHLIHLEDTLRNHGHAVNSVKDANRIKVAKNLCKRLYEEDIYYWSENGEYLKNQDKKMLFQYLDKYMDGWWN